MRDGLFVARCVLGLVPLFASACSGAKFGSIGQTLETEGAIPASQTPPGEGARVDSERDDKVNVSVRPAAVKEELPPLPTPGDGGAIVIETDAGELGTMDAALNADAEAQSQSDADSADAAEVEANAPTALASFCGDIAGGQLFENHCYIDATDPENEEGPLTFTEATEHCAALAVPAGHVSHLLVLNDEAEQAFVVSRLTRGTLPAPRTDVWLNLTCDDIHAYDPEACICDDCGTQWQWQYASPDPQAPDPQAPDPQYTGWGRGNPDGEGPCAALVYDKRDFEPQARIFWADRDCNDRYYGGLPYLTLCEIE